MEEVRSFLESSTIHGLVYISTTNKRLFWILVVIAGFIGAGVMIYQSFEAWEESPVKTTIETRPIREITLPEITVCPPKNTFTDLNYDLMKYENATLDNDIKAEMTTFAEELLQDHLYENKIGLLNLVQESNRYHNWYHGITKIKLPHDRKQKNIIEYFITTTASSGNVSTKYFGDIFDAEKVKRRARYQITIHPTRIKSYMYSTNATLHLQIEKISMKPLATGTEDIFIMRVHDYQGREILDKDIIHVNRNYTPPGPHVTIKLERKVTNLDVRKMKIHQMPGFKLSWFYSGNEVMPHRHDIIYNTSDRKHFIRFEWVLFSKN